VRVSLAAAVEPGEASLRHEDFYCVDPAVGLFVIAEGRGSKGGVVSRMLVRALRQFIVEHQRDALDGVHGQSSSSWTTPGFRLHVAVLDARKIAIDGDDPAHQLVAMCAMLFEGDRLAIARFGGCTVFRLRDERFEQLSDQDEPGEIQAARLEDRELASRALSIHDVEAGPDDHWLLSTSGLPPRLSEQDSRLVIEAWEQGQRAVHKPVVAVANGTDAAVSVAIVGSASV
jgi:serine/threonine protein phosphatase PrpC